MWKGITASHADNKRLAFCMIEQSPLFNLDDYICKELVENKATLWSLHSCQPLNRGKNSRKPLLGRPKVGLTVLYGQYFWDYNNWPLNRCPLYGWLLNTVCQTREVVFHRDVLTPRRELKMRHTLKAQPLNTVSSGVNREITSSKSIIFFFFNLINYFKWVWDSIFNFKKFEIVVLYWIEL